MLSGSAGILPAVAGLLPASIARLRQLSYVHQDIECVFEIFPESHNAGLVSRHGAKTFLLRRSLPLNRRIISYAISGVP
jgi:hypothetical protein